MKTWDDILGDKVAVKPDIDTCIDLMMNAVDELCWAGHDTKEWPDIDHLLETYPWDRDPELWLVVAFMSMVQPVYQSMKHYGPFYEETARRFHDKSDTELSGFARPLHMDG